MRLKNKFKWFVCFFTFLLLSSCVNFTNSSIDSTLAFPITYDTTITQNSLDTSGNYHCEAVSTYSPSCILFEASTGKVLYAKNAQQKMYPASTTKIMTAILALENCNLEDVATVSHNAVYSVPSGYTFANLKEGEQLTIRDLLYSMMIPSANDSAVVLAEHIGGSVESFSTMMNTKASDIGCIGTHFLNPNGIHNTEHYSCAYDLALIGRYAMQNETFRKIVSTTRYTLPTSNKYDKEDRIFNTTNDLIRVNHSSSANNYYYEYCTGIKTGYTDPAKNCIVASAKKDGMELVVAVLGADRTPDDLSGRNLDCKALFDYGFENFSFQTISTPNTQIDTITIPNATPETRSVPIVVKDEITALVPSSFSSNTLEPIIEITKDLKAPLAKSTVVGKVTYTIDGISYSSDLLTATDVIPSNSFYTIVSILGILLSLYFIVKLIKPSKKRRKRKKEVFW